MTDVRAAAMDKSATARASEYRRAGWWPDERLLSLFGRHVAERPHDHAARDERNGWISRRELWEQAREGADTLAAAGVAGGDVVLICAPNGLGWLVWFLATLRIGAVPATIPVTTDAVTLAHVARVVDAALLVLPARHRSRDIAAELAAAPVAAPPALVVAEDGRVELRPGCGRGDSPPQPISGLAHLMFTSSTTGMPKAVAHTENTLAAVNLGFASRFGIDGTAPIFMASPLGHSVGAWHGARLSLFTGAPLVLQDEWDPVRALRLIADEGCVFTAAATPFLKDLVDAPWDRTEPKLAPMRAFLCGGASVPPALLEACRDQLPRTFVSVLWGMTEGGVTTCLPSDSRQRVMTTAGTGLPGLELRILSADGQQLPTGHEGELVMRGPGVFVGYYGQEVLYRELTTADGFFRTGDLAELDPDGYVRVTGRLKDLIIRGGVNISPIPLENALSAHPHVARVAVVGMPDERMGERICAVVVPRGLPPTLVELVRWVQQQGLPRRQWPEQLVVVDAMPQTAAGKIRKPALRAEVLERRR